MQMCTKVAMYLGSSPAEKEKRGFSAGEEPAYEAIHGEECIIFTDLRNNYVFLSTSITTSQDAHKRLVVQVVEWLTASLYQCSRELLDMS